jgi:hypothetical protein
MESILRLNMTDVQISTHTHTMTWFYFNRTAGAIIMRIAYGYEVKETKDPFLATVDETLVQFSLSTAPGGFLVNLVPARAYFFDANHRNALPP